MTTRRSVLGCQVLHWEKYRSLRLSLEASTGLTGFDISSKDKSMHGRDITLNEEVPNDWDNAAPVAWEDVDQFRGWFGGICCRNAFQSAAQRLDDNGVVRAQARLFRADVRIMIRSNIKIGGVKQLDPKRLHLVVTPLNRSSSCIEGFVRRPDRYQEQRRGRRASTELSKTPSRHC